MQGTNLLDASCRAGEEGLMSAGCGLGNEFLELQGGGRRVDECRGGSTTYDRIVRGEEGLMGAGTRPGFGIFYG